MLLLLQETEFDPYTNHRETELANLWERLCEELGFGQKFVVSVEANGYILEYNNEICN
mgnify:CR=1 FL=1